MKQALAIALFLGVWYKTAILLLNLDWWQPYLPTVLIFILAIFSGLIVGSIYGIAFMNIVEGKSLKGIWIGRESS